MRSYLSNKLVVVTLSLLGLVALMGLAIGLRSMPFHERQVFGRGEAEATGTISLQFVDAVLSIPLRIQLMFWSLLIVLALLIGLLMSPELRKWLIRLILRMAAFYWLLYILATRYHEQLAQMVLNLSGLKGLPVASSNNPPAPEFVPPASSSWLAYGLSLALAVILIFVGWKAYLIWQEINAANVQSPIDKLGRIVRASLKDLSAGRDSTDVILNCYFRMSDVVAEKKQLDRKASMTPAEFAARLEQAGLPGDAVRRLTRLFEAARYGGNKSNTAMVNEAVACLTTIMHHCGETV